MRRRVLLILSLLVWFGTVALWVRSYFAFDHAQVSSKLADNRQRSVDFYSEDGRLVVSFRHVEQASGSLSRPRSSFDSDSTIPVTPRGSMGFTYERSVAY